MRKTFSMIHPTKKKDRLFEAAIYDIKRYFKRENKKELPEDYDHWDFDCKYGDNEESAKVIDKNDFSKYITQAKEKNIDSFYIEIIRKPAKKIIKE